MEAYVLTIGTVIGHRFVVERMVGAGGMGMVYRAADNFSGQPVALKLLLRSGVHPPEVERFQREIQAIAELRHPAIVGYVAHGVTAEGQPYLAMEWLEGEELAVRLRRRPLEVEPSLRLAMRIGEALAAAHRHGVVHRDLKPSNIFLRDGEVDQAALIDFGIARRVRGDQHAMTRTGVLLGTPEYMAPEQARGQADVGPAADVFSLGCVLFECLTGQPPFSGEHVTAILARLLFDRAPRLRELRPELPQQLDELLAQMLAREPAERLADGAAVCEALRAMQTLGDLPSLRFTNFTRTPDSSEQHFLSVLLACERTALAERPTLHATLTPARDELPRVLRELGADVELLADGSLAAAFPPRPGLAPGDRAVLAVRAALRVKEQRPGHLVAVATGRGVVGQGIPRGEGIERAFSLLNLAAAPELVRVDVQTSELVAARFELLGLGPEAFAVLGERTSLDESRPLLGRPTPCVGREQELGALEGALMTCIDEQTAHAAIVRAGPGLGKSRLRHELLRRVAVRVPALEVLLGRGDIMRAGAPYSVIVSALRQRWGLSVDDPTAARTQLREALARELQAAELVHASEFLGEMCGVPNPDPSPPLQAALRDPKLMLSQRTAAFINLLRAMCQRAPVLLVLEDLHWGDAPSCTLLDATLRALADQPLMIVAFARPELDELFPGLWQERGVQELRLAGLGRRASERLVHHALGRDFDPALASRLIDQAGGSPLFLEELVRAAAAGMSEVMPDTLLAMMHTRLLRFDPALRRALRAAASFGEHFWRGGLAEILAGERSTVDLDAWLAILLEQEIIVRQPQSRIPDDEEFAFRHALMREAAYSMSSAEGRAHDHHKVAEYLERHGDRDPRVLAEHWQRAGDPARASEYILAAADTSYRACDSVAALALVERGLACEPADEIRASLHAIASWIHGWRLEWQRASLANAEAIKYANPGTLPWCSAMAGSMNLALFSDQLAEFNDLSRRFLATDPVPEAAAAYIFGLASIIALFGMLGERDPATVALERLRIVGDRLPHDSGTRAWMAIARGDYHRSIEQDPAAQLLAAHAAVRLFAEADDRRNTFFANIVAGQAEFECGLLSDGVATLRAALARAHALGDAYFVAMATVHLAAALAQHEEPALRDEGGALAEQLTRLDNLTAGYRTWAHGILAHVLLARGDQSGAETHVLLALKAPSTNVLRLRLAAATHMRVLAARGAHDEARTLLLAERARLVGGALGYARTPLRLAIAEVLHAAGEPASALDELQALREEIDHHARGITDPEARRRFIEDVPIHARAAALARAWRSTHEQEPTP